MTAEVGFLDIEPESAANWWRAEVESGLQEKHGEFAPPFRVFQPEWQDRGDAFKDLQPHIPHTMDAFVPIGTGCVYFNNSPNGTDTALLPRRLPTQLGRRAIQARCVPNKTIGIHPARILTVYDPDPAKSRHISVLSDNGRWSFTEWGTPFEFEELDAYLLRTKSSRLTPERLYQYLAALGIPYDSEPRWNDAWVIEQEYSERFHQRLRDLGLTPPPYWGPGINHPDWLLSHPAARLL